MSDRRVVVEAAFGFGPFDSPGSTDWVELTRPDGKGRVKEARWSIGRDNELSPYPPGTATLLLWDRDRELDPDNSSSSLAGQLLPLVPVRIRSQDLDTLTYSDEFYGFVDGGWERVLAPQGTGDCKIDLVDLLGVIGGYRLPGVFEHAVLALDPVGYWPLTGTGSQVEDLGSGRNDGTPEEAPSFGAEPLFPGLGSSVEFDGEHQRIDITRSPLDIDTFHCSLICVLDTAVPAETGTFHTIWCMLDGNNPSVNVAMLYTASDGTLRFEHVQGGQGVDVTSEERVDNGRPHLIFAQSNVGFATDFGIAIDTATLTSIANIAGAMAGNGVAIGGTPFAPLGYTANFFPGRIGHFAVIDAVLTEVQRQSVVDALPCLAGARSDEQIAWALERVGVPAALFDFDAGAVLMGAADTAGREAIEFVRDVVATEQGDLYIDHRNGGMIRFRSRYGLHTDTRSTTSQATFSDDPNAVGVIRYAADGLDIVPNGRDGVINQASVSWAGGEVVRDDATSIAAYGPRSRRVETVATTAAQAESVAEWLLARYASPRSRVRGAVASPPTAQGRDDLVQDRELGDRVTFRFHPLGEGTAAEVDLWVDGIDNETRGAEWVTSFRFAPVDTFAPWIWGTSQWGVDNLWG